MATNNGNGSVHDISSFIEVPQEYYSISVPKLKIIKAIKDGLAKNNLTVRKAAEKVGVQHPQIIRVTSGENYNIDTLLRILDALDLEIEIREKDRSTKVVNPFVGV